ncbi:kinesin-F [Trypoxylus dichotomus]
MKKHLVFNSNHKPSLENELIEFQGYEPDDEETESEARLERVSMVRQLEFRCRNAKVFFRVLPMPKICWENVKLLDDRETIYVRYRQELNQTTPVDRPNYWCFKTDGVFYNSTQNEIYNTIVPELLENVIKGYHGVIFCFGQTGTGKSLTTIGIENSYEDRGIVPRLISNLFTIKEELKNKYKMCFKLSYIEATKTHIRDLLKSEETSFDVHTMKEVSNLVFQNEQDMLKSIYKGEGRKTLTKNPIYQSHAANSVLTLTIITRQVNDSSLVRNYSKLHVVDLAGADSFGNKTSLDKSLNDIATGNLAKTQLEQFLLVLIENIPEQIAVKQRLSILIAYLKDCLNSSSMLRFIGHIRVDDENLPITLSMLRFGQIIHGLKPKKMQLHRYDDQETKLKYLEEELRTIKMKQTIDSMIRNQDLRSNLTQDRVNRMKRVAEDYLRNKIDELTVANVTDINTVLKVFKIMFRQQESDRGIVGEGGYNRRSYFYDETSSKRSSTKSIVSQRSSRKTSKTSGKSRESMRPMVRQSKEKGSKSKSFTARSVSKGSTVEKPESPILSRLNVLNNAKSKDSLDKSAKRPRSMRRSSSTRRRSSDSQRERLLEETMLLPEALPSPSEAWRGFTTCDLYNYDELKRQADEYEAHAKRLNARYVEEAKKLQQRRELMFNCQDKLYRIRMQREISGLVERDDTGMIVKTEQELKCEDMFTQYEHQVVQQQEVVLTLQSELQMYLEQYQEKRKKINEGFETFCTDRYKTMVPLSGISQEAELEVASKQDDDANVLTKYSATDIEDSELDELRRVDYEYEKLKSLTVRQRQRKLRDQLLRKRWVQSCNVKNTPNIYT